MKVANHYARFRGSVWFLVILCIIIVFWISWNLCPFLPHFDDDGFGRLNLLLSSEASISVALLIMAGDKREEAETRNMKYMMDLLEGMALLLEQEQKKQTRGKINPRKRAAAPSRLELSDTSDKGSPEKRSPQ